MPRCILVKRCQWAESSEIMKDYHDNEWGKPVFDDLGLFSKLMLDCQQAGLSWAIILNKRVAFLKAFDDFNPYLVAYYDDQKINELLNNPGIVRNKLKISAMIHNSKLYIEHFSEKGSFSDFIWKYVNHQTVDHQLKTLAEIPTTTAVSDQISKDLKKLGFKFVGSTVVYAFLQAVGVYNDHLVTCISYNKYKESV